MGFKKNRFRFEIDRELNFNFFRTELDRSGYDILISGKPSSYFSAKVGNFKASKKATGCGFKVHEVEENKSIEQQLYYPIYYALSVLTSSL
jgi:hypothetical protein